MNCKQGDLAIVVGSDFGQNGMIVTCLRLLKTNEVVDNIRFLKPGVTWVVDRPLTYRSAHLGVRVAHIAPDEALRPIGKPSDDEVDETLLWLPVPSTETADA